MLRLSCERQGGGAEMWVRAAVVAALLPVATGQIGGDDAISIGARVWLGRLALSLIHTDRTCCFSKTHAGRPCARETRATWQSYSRHSFARSVLWYRLTHICHFLVPSQPRAASSSP